MTDSNKNTNIKHTQHCVCNFCNFGKGICLYFIIDPHWFNFTFIFFYLVSFTDTGYSFPAHEHSDIYLQLSIWDDYRVFLTTPDVINRLLHDEKYPPLGNRIWLNNECILGCWFNVESSCSSNILQKSGEFELTTVIAQVFQTKWLTKCASHPNIFGSK